MLLSRPYTTYHRRINVVPFEIRHTVGDRVDLYFLGNPPPDSPNILVLYSNLFHSAREPVSIVGIRKLSGRTSEGESFL